MDQKNVVALFESSSVFLLVKLFSFSCIVLSIIIVIFNCSVKDCKKDLKVKAKAPMTKFLGVVKKTLSEWRREPSTEGLRYQLIHMRDILERWKVRHTLFAYLVDVCTTLKFDYFSLLDCRVKS